MSELVVAGSVLLILVGLWQSREANIDNDMVSWALWTGAVVTGAAALVAVLLAGQG